MLYRRRQGADVNSLYEAVDNIDLDACPFIQFLRRHDNAGQKISGADICRLQLSGEIEDLRDGHPLADQRRGEFAAGGDKLVKLAFDIETEEHEAELFRILRKSRGFGGLNRRNLRRDSRRSRQTRRLHLTGRGRDARSRDLLRLSQIAGSCDKQRPQQYSSQQAHESAHAPTRGLFARTATWDTDRRKTRSHYKLAERICCASSAHRISTHDSSLRVRSRAHSVEPRRNSLERGEIVTVPRGVP